MRQLSFSRWFQRPLHLWRGSISEMVPTSLVPVVWAGCVIWGALPIIFASPYLSHKRNPVCNKNALRLLSPENVKQAVIKLFVAKVQCSAKPRSLIRECEGRAQVFSYPVFALGPALLATSERRVRLRMTCQGFLSSSPLHFATENYTGKLWG